MKLVVDVVNSGRVTELTAEIKRQEAAIVAWNAQMRAGTLTQAQFNHNAQAAAISIRTMNAELRTLKTASETAGRGLGQLAYAVDDIQYGFSAIVNNIPGIVMGLGGSAGLAGALGIAAVAANQMYKHWDQLSATFGNTAPFETVRGAIEEVKGVFAASNKEISQMNPGIQAIVHAMEPYIARWKEATRAAEAHKATLEKIAEAEKMLGGTKDVKESKRGAEFKEAIERAGGGDAVVKAMTDAAVKAGNVKDPEMRKKIQENIELTLREGLQGKNVDKALTPAMREQLDKVRNEDANAEKAKGQQRGGEFMQEATEQHYKEMEDQNKLEIEGRKNVKQSDKDTAIKTLEDQRKKVMDDQHAFDEAMWQKQHNQLRAPQIIEGVKASLDLYQTAGKGDNAKELAKQAHDQREKSRKLLESIDASLKKERRVIVR